MFPFESHTTVSISGCTGSGKTTWVRKLMKYTREMFEGPSPDNILYCYGIYQNAFDEMEKVTEPNIFARVTVRVGDYRPLSKWRS